MALIRPLLLNKTEKNVIQRNHLDISIQKNDIDMILLRLFVF